MSLSVAEIGAATSTETSIAQIDLVEGDSMDVSSGVLPQGKLVSAVVVHAPDGWTALCEDLEVAADGDDAQDAFQNLLRAVEAVLQVDKPEDRPQTPAKAVLELMDSHQGPEPLQVFSFRIPAA